MNKKEAIIEMILGRRITHPDYQENFYITFCEETQSFMSNDLKVNVNCFPCNKTKGFVLVKDKKVGFTEAWNHMKKGRMAKFCDNNVYYYIKDTALFYSSDFEAIVNTDKVEGKWILL